MGKGSGTGGRGEGNDVAQPQRAGQAQAGASERLFKLCRTGIPRSHTVPKWVPFDDRRLEGKPRRRGLEGQKSLLTKSYQLTREVVVETHWNTLPLQRFELCLGWNGTFKL